MSQSSRASTSPWEVPFVRVDRLLQREERCVVDLRSPSEFAEDHLPGAISVPLFDDAERALVGTLYKRASPEEAFARGREFAAARIRGLVQEIARAARRDLPAGELAGRVLAMTETGLDSVQRAFEPTEVTPGEAPPLILHCWRGGMRSASVVAFLRALGWEDVFGLIGGYKAYRRSVLEAFSAWEGPPVFVLRGSTGVGKTLLLNEVERQRPGWTLDLEAAAGHRSSILGMVGREPCTQKTFDSRLASRLRQLDGPCVVIEGESRKVGDSIIPESLWRGMLGARNVYLEARTGFRVQVLMEDYLATTESRADLRRQLPFIGERLRERGISMGLVDMLDSGREPELVELLLEHYYDPLYAHSEAGREYHLRLEVEDIAHTARSVVEWIEAELAASPSQPSQGESR